MQRSLHEYNDWVLEDMAGVRGRLGGEERAYGMKKQVYPCIHEINAAARISKQRLHCKSCRYRYVDAILQRCNNEGG